MPPTRPLPSFSLHRRHSLIKDPHFGPWGSPIGQTRQSTEFYRVFFLPLARESLAVGIGAKTRPFFSLDRPFIGVRLRPIGRFEVGPTHTHTHTHPHGQRNAHLHTPYANESGWPCVLFFWRVPPSRLRWHYRRPLKSSRISGNYRGFFFTEFSRESRNSLGVSPRSFFFIVSSSLESFLTLRLRLLRCDLLR